MTLKMRIMLRALRLRIAAGEEAGAVIDSYPRLTEEEKNCLREKI